MSNNLSLLRLLIQVTIIKNIIKVKSFLSQVVLTGTTAKAVSAVKELVYKGTCHLDEV